MKIRLIDADQKRLGCAEWLDYERDHLELTDAEALEAAGGKWTDFPQSTLAGARARVWVALHRAGITVTPFEALTFDILGIRYDDVESPGKAPSAPSGSATRSTSRGSARRTRSKT